MHASRKHTPHQSASFSQRRRNRLITYLVTSVVLIVCLCVGLSYFFSLSSFEITSVKIFGADEDITPVLQQTATELIQGSYLGIFKRSSALIYPKGKIISTLTARSPRISSVAITRDGWHTLIITIGQKTPRALVCASLPDWNEGTLSADSLNQCYFADETGYIFEPAPSFSGHIYNRYFIPDASAGTSSDALVGTYATSSVEFTQLQSLYENIKSLKINPEGLLIKDNGEYELYADEVHRDSKGKVSSDIFVVYVNNARPFTTEFDNFASFWNSKTATHNTPHFEYIDVRYGSNVFFKITD